MAETKTKPVISLSTSVKSVKNEASQLCGSPWEGIRLGYRFNNNVSIAVAQHNNKFSASIPYGSRIELVDYIYESIGGGVGSSPDTNTTDK